MQAVRAPWSTSSFLLYAGGITIAFATGALLQALSGDYSKAAFVAWALLVVAVLDGVAWVLRRREPLAAGLIVLSGVFALAVLVGALEDWFGWLAHPHTTFAGLHLGVLVVVAALLADSLFALRVWRFPLLVLVACLSGWYLVADLLSSGGDWTATVTIAVGVVYLLVALGLDRVYAFWVHTTAGLLIGGGLLYFWHSGDVDWLLIVLASLAYVALASALDRSSYAVLAALGLFMATTHFADSWSGGLPIPFFGGILGSGESRPWLRALVYVACGAVLMLLGLWVARRRPAPPA